MPKLGIEIENNVNKNVSDFNKLDRSVDRVGKSVDQTSKKIKGMGSGLSKALGAFAIGGAIQKGINIIASDIEKAAADTVKNNRSSALLFGQLGVKGVEAARSLAVAEGFDLQRTQQLIFDIESGTAASGISTIEKNRLATLAIRAEKAIGISETVTSRTGSQFINAAPGQFAQQGGSVAVTNLIRGIGALGNIPTSTDIRQGAGAVATGAAADIPVRASESAAVFTFLTGSQIPATAGTSAKALLKKYQTLGGTKTFTEWLDDLLPLSAAELLKKLGDQEAVGAVGAIKANPKGYRLIRQGLDDAVSNPQSSINKEFKNRLRVDKVFAATQALDRSNISNSVGSTTGEALSIIQAQLTTDTLGDRFVAGATDIFASVGELREKIANAGGNEFEDTEFTDLARGVSDRNIRELANKELAADQIGAIREMTSATQSSNATNQVTRKTEGGQ
jgi:hypothetical protein